MIEIKNIAECPQHIETICRWHHNEWAHLNPGRPLENRFEEMQEHLDGKLVPATFVAVEENKPVGSASILRCDMDIRSELTPWLASVYVLADWRHRGIGRALVQKIMSHAKEGGIKKLYLYTPDKEHFYRHMGWQTIEKLVYHDTPVTIMEIDFNHK
ncbi:MAG: GNAT family N-acetyltransferase [Candidatus Rifleibacteriota bacterium]